MRFRSTRIAGVCELEAEPHKDERGWFARWWCPQEMAMHGLNPSLAQVSVSSNLKKGTIRGMHFQKPPHAEAKLVRVIRGAIMDVALDLRPDSPTYLDWHSVELTADNGRSLFIGEGLAHGFQTLTDNTEVLYMISAPHHPASASGVRWDDPIFGISWPLPVSIISSRDQNYLDFRRPDS